MKLVKVNARVTFVVWVLECVANLSVAILWVFVYGTTTFGTLTNSMMWYYLIISYTFLMNTSYNKDRIIEDGWKIVILNSMKSILHRIHQIDQCISGSSINDSINSACQNLGENNPDSQDITQNEKRNIPKNSEPNKKYLKPRNDLRRSPKPDIFIIYNPENQHSPLSHSSKYEPGDLEQIHIRNSNTSSMHHSRASAMSSSSSTVSEYDDQNRPLSNRVKIGKKLLTEMEQCLGDENEFLHYFFIYLLPVG